LWANFCIGQTSAPTPKSLDGFDAIVTKAMAESKIPGLSVAIVYDGKVIYAKGFGDYSLGDDTAHVSLAGDTLQLTIPDEPSYDLVPTRGLIFNLKGLNGFSVEFKRDASGKISEMLVVQPEGATVAKKKL
jgi:hypothetical protein